MPHLTECFGLNLTNAFASDLELSTDFFQGSAVTVYQAKPLLEHLSFPLGQRVQNVADFLAQEDDSCHLAGVFRTFIFDEIAEAGIVAVTDWRLQRDGLLSHLK